MLKVSHSGCQAYRECAHLFYLSRVADGGYEAVEQGRAPAFGTAGHKSLELSANGYTGPSAGMNARLEALGKEDAILLNCLLLAYRVRYGAPEGKAEGKFEVPLIGPDGKPDPSIVFRGAIDIETPEYVMDHKFTSANLTPTFVKNLERNPQAEEYLIAAQERGSKATYAIWDIIRSTPYRRRLATPEAEREFYKRKGKYGDVGDPKPGTYLEDETWEEFRQRIVDDIAAEPDKFFMRVRLDKTEEELDRRRYDLWGVAKQIEHSIEIGAFPRNEQRCPKFGGCEFQPVCWEGVDPAQSELYQLRKREE